MSALVSMIRTEELMALGDRCRTTLEQTEMVETGATAVKLLLVNYFTDLNAERHRSGGPAARTGFYADAARSVNAAPVEVEGKSALISIDKIGLAQRLLGGTIRPLPPHKFLAIPAREEAYDTTPADYTDLTFVPRGNGKAMLVQALKTTVDWKEKRRKGSTVSDYARTVGGLVMFWLVPEVEQAPDPTVLPADEAMEQSAFTAMDEFLTRRLASNH